MLLPFDAAMYAMLMFDDIIDYAADFDIDATISPLLPAFIDICLRHTIFRAPLFTLTPRHFID